MSSSSASISRFLSRDFKDNFRSAPRFGHSNNFSHLFSKDDDEFYDYLVGLLAISILIVSFFLFWGLVLLVLKFCVGKKRVGFLSGAPFEMHTRTSSNPMIQRGRAVFAGSCLLFLFFAITLVTAGIGNLESTSESVGYGATVSCMVWVALLHTKWRH